MKWLDTYLFFSPRVAKYEVLSPYEAESELSATWEIGLGTCGERSSVGTGGCCHMQPIYSNYLSRSLQVQYIAALLLTRHVD